MKVRITRKEAIVLALLLLFISLILTILPKIQLPVYSVNYLGTKLSFRVNLKDVEKIPVYPDEEAIQKLIMNSVVDNITIVFKPGSGQENSHYAVEVFEIVSKLAIAYKMKFAYIPNFNVINVTSYENLNASDKEPIIALIHPIYSNESSVRLDGNIVYVQGKNATSLTGQLRNFDLATAKFLMVALGIKI